MQQLFTKRASEDTWLIIPCDPAKDAAAERISYRETYERSLRWAAVLRAHCEGPRAAVALVLDNGVEFCVAFFGALLAGLVPVPIAPPTPLDGRDEYIRRTAAVVDDAASQLVIVDDAYEWLVDTIRTARCAVKTSRQVEEKSVNLGATLLAPYTGTPDETCFLQYTSGTTRLPRGVELSHSNVLANIRGTGIALGAKEGETTLCWLPLFHDMGLSATLLYSMYWNMSIVLMSPMDFIFRPASWLWAIARFNVVGCAAPNFAYALCASKTRVPDRLLEGLDLRLWRVAVNAAETVQAATIDAFASRFARYGFRRGAMRPCYGLAEHVAACCLVADDQGPRYDCVDRETLEREATARPVPSESPRVRTMVGVGKPMQAHAVRIVSKTGYPVPDRVVGEIQACGPSVMRGYRGDPNETASVLTANGWLSTGDLGYLSDHCLYVVGRIKDIIKKGGAAYDAADIQAIAAEVKGVRAGCVAVFGLNDESADTEQICVLAETKFQEPESLAALRMEITQRIMRKLSVRPDVVQFVEPNALPKSTSGKIRNSDCRRGYLAGDLRILVS